MSEMPPRPTKLSLWMGTHGRPNRLTVRYIQTGPDTADTTILLEVVHDGKVLHSTSVTAGAIPVLDRFGVTPGNDCRLILDHAHVVDWTEHGKKRLEAWKAWQDVEARDLAEYARLKKKFTPPKDER